MLIPSRFSNISLKSGNGVDYKLGILQGYREVGYLIEALINFKYFLDGILAISKSYLLNG